MEQIFQMEFKKVSFAQDANHWLLENISFSFPVNKIVFLRSSSKNDRACSLLLKLLCGLYQPHSGHYIINGENSEKLSFESFERYRQHFGYTFENGGIFFNRSLYENLMMPIHYHGFFDKIVNAENLVDLFGLQENIHLFPAQVTGAQRKLITVLRSLSLEPSHLFLDDPFGGLDDDHLILLKQYILDKFHSRQLKGIFLRSPQAVDFFDENSCIIDVKKNILELVE